MKKTRMTRRRFVATTAAASATMIAAPFVRTANAAGKLSIGFWDHWVPGANKTSEALVQEWAAKEKVEVQIDYITSQGFKNLLTIAAEAQAKSGHDILAMPTWWPQDQALNLEPVNDIMEPLDQAEWRGQRHGRVPRQEQGTWLAVPATIGSQIKGPCSRIDLMKQHAGIDVQALYPAGSAAEGRQLDRGHLPQGRRSLPQGRLPVRHRPRADLRLGRYRRRLLPVVRRRARECEGRPHGQDRRGAAGARLLHARGEILSARRPVMGRCLQQQVAGVRPRRADHEPAERLGGGQARCAAGRRAMLDARLPGGSQGSRRAVPALLLGHLELRQEQVGGQEPARAHVAAGARSRSWLPPAAATTCRPSPT